MEIITSKSVTIATTGGAGASTGAGTIDNIVGFLLDVFVDWSASAAATAVLTIKNAKGVTLLATPAGKTDALYAPRKDTVTAAGVATGLYDLWPVNGALTFTITLSDDTTDNVVTIRYLQV